MFSHVATCKDTSIIEEAILVLLINNMNNLLTVIPSMEDIHDVMFKINKDISPSPYGLVGIFLSNLLEHCQGGCL